VVPFSMAKTPLTGPVFYDHTQLMNSILEGEGNKLSGLEHRKILEYSNQGFVSRNEPLTVESLLIVVIQDRIYQHMLYLPGKEKELALGFLLTSGVIESLEDIASFEFLPESPPSRPNQVKIWLAREAGLGKIQDNHGALAQAVLHGQAEASRKITAVPFCASRPPTSKPWWESCRNISYFIVRRVPLTPFSWLRPRAGKSSWVLRTWAAIMRLIRLSAKPFWSIWCWQIRLLS
jgi:hypothetical protein